MDELLPVNIENLKAILNGIQSGALDHTQEHYNCGTSCCLAGWDFTLNFKGLSTPDFRSMESMRDFFDRAYNGIGLEERINIWDWSERNNNLSEAEAQLLFHSNSNRYTHKKTITALEAGRRLDINCIDTSNILITVLNDNSKLNYFVSDKVQFYLASDETQIGKIQAKLMDFLEPSYVSTLDNGRTMTFYE